MSTTAAIKPGRIYEGPMAISAKHRNDKNESYSVGRNERSNYDTAIYFYAKIKLFYYAVNSIAVGRCLCFRFGVAAGIHTVSFLCH